jgi:hypothetical protein
VSLFCILSKRRERAFLTDNGTLKNAIRRQHANLARSKTPRSKTTTTTQAPNTTTTWSPYNTGYEKLCGKTDENGDPQPDESICSRCAWSQWGKMEGMAEKPIDREAMCVKPIDLIPRLTHDKFVTRIKNVIIPVTVGVLDSTHMVYAADRITSL